MGRATVGKVLRIEEIAKSYKRRRVVDKVSLEVRQGETVGLLGPNGAGKTTSFYIIAGLIPADEGRVLIDQKDISSMPMYLRARQGIGYLPQESSIFRKLTVRKNLEAVLEIKHKKRQQIDKICQSLIQEMHLEAVAEQKGYTLSGGERRRCELARALASEPYFILLDEPFAGIDPIAVADIQSMMTQLRQRGLGILITDHNVRETLQITDRSYIMYNGQILRSGSPQKLVADTEIREKYLGSKFRL